MMSVTTTEKTIFEMNREELADYNQNKLLEFKDLFLNTDLPIDEIYTKLNVDKGDPTYRYIESQRSKEELSAKTRNVKFEIKEQSTEERYKELEDFYQEFKKIWIENPKISKNAVYEQLGKTQQKERVNYVNERLAEDNLPVNHHSSNHAKKKKKWRKPGRKSNATNIKTNLIHDKTPEKAYQEYKHLFFNTEISIKEIYEMIGVPQNQNTHYVYIRRHAEQDGLNGYSRRLKLKHGGRPKGSKDLKKLTGDEKEIMDKYFEERYQEFLKYYDNLDLSVQDILKKMGTHHKSNMYYYFRERMAEDGLDPTKRQGKVISKKVKKTYENRRKQNEPAYEEAYQEYKKLYFETQLSMSEIWEKLDVEPRSVCAKYIRNKAKEEGLNNHERRWKLFGGYPQREKYYEQYKKLFLESDMNLMDIYKEIGVSYDSNTGHYIRERGASEGLDTSKRKAMILRSRTIVKHESSLEECEQLFLEYKRLFIKSKLKIPEIYDKIGVSQGSYVFKYIRKRAREEGLDGKKRMYGLMRSKSTKTKYSNYKNKGKKRKRRYSKRTLEQVENSKDMLNQVFMERNIKEHTAKGYLACMHHWFELFGDKYNSLKEIIDSYIYEEDQHIPMRERTMKKDLLKFREYLINCETIKSSKSVMSYYQKFTAVLRHFGLEVPILPKAKLEKGYVSNYDDLPTHEMIKTACDQSSLPLKMTILFMSSSGSAKAETLSITIGMFLEGCKEYLKERPTPDNMVQCIQELKDRHDIVPLIYLRRLKTDKWYYTCCSPEASYCIIKYLNNMNLGWDEQLFPFKSSLLLTRLQEINDNNNWGKVGSYRRFRGHVLRKFMASNIGLPRDQVDSFQGRSKDMIAEAYFKQDPKQLKKIYMDAMHRVMIYDNWGYGVTAEELSQNNISIEESVIDDSINEELIVEEGPGEDVIETQVVKSQNENKDVSIADELLKYSQLQKEGFITMDEFNAIKSKLIGGLL